MAVVNLGNDQLNINTTTAKGLEKVIGVIARFVLSAQNQTNQLLYGKGGDDPNTKGIQRVIDRGLLGVIEDIAGVDFCNLINYVANKGNPKKNTFDPNGPKENATPFQKRIWTVQSYAFKIQQNIDRYYSVFGISTGQDSRQALLGLLTSINLEMENLLSPSIGLNDPEILAEFPQMANATNYLSNAIANLNKYTNRREIPLTEITKILNTIDKLRLVCTTIVNLNAAALIGAATSLLRGKLQEDFNKINKFVTPGPKIIAFLTDLIKKVQNINSTAQKILGYVDTARGIIRIAIFLIKIFNILKTFLLVLPLPSLLTTAGIQTVFSKTYNQVLEDQGTKKLITRLNQINLVLNIIIIFVTSLIVALNTIIQSLTQILLNIKSCGTSSDQTGLEGLNEAERENNLLSLTLDDPGRISGAGTSNSTGNIVDTSFGRGRGRRGNTRRGTGIGQLGGTGVGGLGTGTGVIRPDAATLIPRNGLNGNTLADLALLIERTIGDLTGTRNRLQAFVDSYNRNKNLVDKTFFGYTIDIVTEELVDEGITLRRRYGIARSPQNIIVVETTPTFASLDLIIINEVKTLLISRGFVDLGLGSFGAALGQRGIGLGVNGTALGSAGRSLDRPGVGRQANSLGVGLSGNIATPGGSGFSSAQIKRGQQNLNTTSGRTGNLFNNTRGNENLSGIGNRPGDFVSTGLSDSSNARPGGPTTAEAIASAGGGTGIGGAIGALNAQDSEVIIESLNYLGDPNITLGTADVSATDVGGGSFGTSFGGELSQEGEDDLQEQAEDDAEVNNEVRDFVESVPKGKKLRNKVKEKLKKAIQKLIQKVKGTDPQYGTNKDAQSIVGDVIKNIGG